MRGQFHPVGDLVEGRFDAVAPLGDDFQQDGGHSRALFLPRRDEDGGAALSLGERGFALMSQRWRALQHVHDRRHRQVRARAHAIRAQNDQLKVAEKTSLFCDLAIETNLGA
jgi:hypothetical protein